jgi:hypothetical protein
MSAFPPLLGVERTSIGQPLNEYTAYLAAGKSGTKEIVVAFAP